MQHEGDSERPATAVVSDVSEADMLREAIRKADALLGIAPAFFGFLSLEGAVTDCNQLALDVIEAGLSEIRGQLFWEAPWWKKLPASAARVEKAVREAALGRPSRFEIEYWSIQRGIGSKRWVNLEIRPMRDGRGQVSHLAATGIDISEQMEGQEAIRRSEDRLWDSVEGLKAAKASLEEANRETELARSRLMGLFHHAPFIIGTLRGPEHVFEMVNPRAQQLLGVGRELVGNAVRTAVPEVMEQGFGDLLDRVYATAEPFVGVEALVKLDRSGTGVLEDCYITFVIQPRLDAQKRPEGIDVFGFEVTDHVRMRREAEAAAESNRVLAEAIPQQVWTATPDGSLDFVNGRVLAYFDATRDQVLGAGWQAVIHPDDLPTCMDRWMHALTSGEGYEIEFRLRRADGVYRWHLGRALPMKDSTGAIRRWFGTNTDIDDARKRP